MCDKEALKLFIESLDKKFTKKVQRDVRRTERRNFGNSRMDVAKVYSPPRVCATARKIGLTAGCSFDLIVNDENGEPWDLSIESVQRKALRKWEEEKPWLLVASPPCTMFNLLQNLSLA